MSKEEIQELKSEIKRLKNLLRLRDDPNPVSPLAPKGGFLDLPEIDGVEFASAAAAVHYKGRNDVMLAKVAPAAQSPASSLAPRRAPRRCWIARARSLNCIRKRRLKMGSRFWRIQEIRMPSRVRSGSEL